MYNLAILFIEKPEKFEQLLIIALKFLTTIFLSSLVFNYNLCISDLLTNPFPKEFSPIKIILFISSLFIVWFVVWDLIAELIIGNFVIGVLSRIGNSKIMFSILLESLNIIKKDKENLSPAENVIVFNDFINNFHNEDETIIEESKGRGRQYYIVSTVIFLTIVFSNEIALPKYFIWIGIIIIVNFLLGSIIFNKVHNYFSENIVELKRQFSFLAYAQLTINAISQNSYIKRNYDIVSKYWTQITLIKKTKNDKLPDGIRFYPFYYWNDNLTMTILDEKLLERKTELMLKAKAEHDYDVLVCNIEPLHITVCKVMYSDTTGFKPKNKLNKCSIQYNKSN